jgi:hypothetical protein
MMVAVGLIPRFEVWRAFSVAERRLKSESMFVSAYFHASRRDAGQDLKT